MEKPIKKIAVTGGGGQIAYNLLFRIASGEMLGKNQPMELRILELPQAQSILDGVIMELEDCAFPLLKKVHGSVDPYDVFEEVNYALLVGAKPRGAGMERKELLFDNAKIFVDQGKALSEKAAKDVLVLVVGNPCNTNALIAAKNAPNIDKRRFFAMTRLDQNRACALLAKKAGVGVDQVENMTIWGNHSSTQVPDFTHAKIGGKPAEKVIKDRKWLENEFMQTVQKRGAAVIKARGKSSAASAANGVIDTIQSLVNPTPRGEWFSVALCSNQNPYGVDNDLVFSFPCRSKGGAEVEIVPDLPCDDFIKEKIALSEKELVEERELVGG